MKEVKELGQNLLNNGMGKCLDPQEERCKETENNDSTCGTVANQDGTCGTVANQDGDTGRGEPACM